MSLFESYRTLVLTLNLTDNTNQLSLPPWRTTITSIEEEPPSPQTSTKTRPPPGTTPPPPPPPPTTPTTTTPTTTPTATPTPKPKPSFTSKVCNHHKCKKKKILRNIFASLLIVSFIILFIFLITWGILQPKKPTFILQDATVYNFNVTAPILLSSNIQVTVSSRNPNSKIGIFYDKFDIYATYNNQQITYYTELLPGYQGAKDFTIYSPFVFGTNVPIAPYNGIYLTQDQANGVICLLFKINGLVRWKVGSVISGRHHLHVTCKASIPFGNHNAGILVGTAIKYQFSEKCSVSV